MLLYTCDGLEESDLVSGGDCFDGSVSSRVTACTSQSELLAGWSVGGSVSIISCINHTQCNLMYQLYRTLYIPKVFLSLLVDPTVHSI